LRIEFRNAAENQGHIETFYCDGELSRDDFLSTSAEDGKKRPLEMAAFRHFIVKEREGRLFETQKQFLRDMANEQHLNFNPAVLAALLPQAMAFTNRESFDNFIRDFVLPGDQLDVDNVVASYKSFLAFEGDLKELRDQKTRLESIKGLFGAYTDAKRDQVVARWLAAELTHAHAVVVAREKEEKLKMEKEAFAKEEERIAILEKLIAERKSEIEQLNNLIKASPAVTSFSLSKDEIKPSSRKSKVFALLAREWKTRSATASAWRASGGTKCWPRLWRTNRTCACWMLPSNDSKAARRTTARRL
jgi:hypothetical protein